MTDKLLTVNEVAERFRRDPRTVRRWAHEGRLEGVIYIPGRFGPEMRIPERSLDAIITHKRPAPDVRKCAGVKRDGSRCKATALVDSPFCRWHQNQEADK